MTQETTPTGAKRQTATLDTLLRVLAADVKAGAPRPYSITIPNDGTAKIQLWGTGRDVEVDVATWGRVLGATSVRVEHGWGTYNGPRVHYSVTGEYVDGWILEVWNAGPADQRDSTTSFVPLSVYDDRIIPADEDLERPTSTPVAWTEPGRALEAGEIVARAFDDPPALDEADVYNPGRDRALDTPVVGRGYRPETADEYVPPFRPDDTDWRRYEGRD